MLTSLKNPWVKQLRKLHQTKYRQALQQFLLEGTHLLQEAIATEYPLDAVCATPHWLDKHPDLWTQLHRLTTQQQIVSPEVMAAIATTTTPDGVIAIAPVKWQEPIFSPIPSLGIAVEGLQDPGNAGTLIRTAAAVGSDGIWCSQDSVDLTHPRVLRASAGQWFRLPKRVSPNVLNELMQLQEMGCQILATAMVGAIPYWDVDLTLPTILVLGNEGSGLSQPLLAQASQVVSIPMASAVESLNVSIAAAVILFEAKRQRYQTAANPFPVAHPP